MKFYLTTLKHLVIQLAKLQIYTLNLTTTFWHCKKKSHYFWTGVYNSIRRHAPDTRAAVAERLLFFCGAVESSMNSISLYSDVIMSAKALKSPASRLFTAPFIQADIKETAKLRVTSPCEGNSLVTGEFLAQRASNTENVSIWRPHHGSSCLVWYWCKSVTFEKNRNNSGSLSFTYLYMQNLMAYPDNKVHVAHLGPVGPR